MVNHKVYILENDQFLELNHEFQAYRTGILNGDTKDSFHPYAEKIKVENTLDFIDIVMKYQDYSMFSEFPKAFKNDVAMHEQEVREFSDELIGYLYESNEMRPDEPMSY